MSKKNRLYDIEALKEYGVTQSMIAEEMGVDRQQVNYWFTGARNLTPVSMKRVCCALMKLTGMKFYPADVYKIVNEEKARRAKK